MANELLNNVLLLLLFLSILTVVRHTFLFVQAWIATTRYNIKKDSLLYLGRSIFYILVLLTKGIFV